MATGQAYTGRQAVCIGRALLGERPATSQEGTPHDHCYAALCFRRLRGRCAPGPARFTPGIAMPIDYRRYPADWPAIRAAILERDGHKCAFCGAPNHTWGARDPAGRFHAQEYLDTLDATPYLELFGRWPRLFRIVLTCAHLDQDIQNNEPANLAMLCQKCHLSHDRSANRAKAAATRLRKRAQIQPSLLP